ncbi:MAG: hypothetical protein JWQ38_66 [Flavipsychrobacter sp.]|nr:hypothetical protein [Flavipsychrobacter sp.]
MSQEQTIDLITWWNEQSFAGKELYSVTDNGTLILSAGNNIKEREIATLSPENADVVLKTLQEKFASVESKVREMEVEWLAAEDKLKLADKVAALKDFLHKVAAVGDIQKPALLIHDWEHTIYTLTEEHYTAKLKIAEQAESLAESDLWKETAQAFRDIAEVWRNAGYLDKQRNDQLWNRIEAARKTFQERKKRNHEEEEKDLLVNLDLKIDLVEQAESIAHSTEWKKTTETFHRLTEEWKTIGYTLNKKNEELWQRFLAAKSTFFESKRQHYNLVQAEQEANYAVKLAIVEKAEALKDSTEWNATAQAYGTLMEEWKKTGRVPQAKADELWKRYTDAQEIFFDAKRKHTDIIKADLESNYNLKKAILERVQKLQYSNQWSDTTTLMNELMEEWKKIGAVPRVHSEQMWEDLNAARKNFFARKDASREQRKQYAEDQKAVRIAQAKGMVTKLHQDIKEEEEKIADFKVAIENITPGKKAEELRSHLAKLIEEGTKNIARWQQTLALANEDVAPKEEKEQKQPAAAEVSATEPE